MKKYLAPVLVAIFMIIYFIIYFGFIITLIESLIFKVIIGIVPVAFAGVMIFVLVERIKEIRSGEENDLSNY